jgi:hypothetical protein
MTSVMRHRLFSNTKHETAHNTWCFLTSSNLAGVTSNITNLLLLGMDPLHSPPSYRLTRFCRLGPLPLVQLLDDRPYTPADVTPAADIMGAISSKPFTPAYADVCAARATLKSLKLPTELVLQILDHARYWPSYEFKGSKVSAENGASISLLENIYDRANVFGSLATNEALKVKEIEFEIRSRDQGWTSEGTEGMLHLPASIHMVPKRNILHISTKPISRLFQFYNLVVLAADQVFRYIPNILLARSLYFTSRRHKSRSH